MAKLIGTGPQQVSTNGMLGSMAFQNREAISVGAAAVTSLTGYVKANGSSLMTAAATVPYDDLSGRAFIQALSTSNQTGSISAATAITFNSGTTGTGINVVSNTQITFTAAGTYMVAPNFQFKNTDTQDQDVTVWWRKNGANVANSATVITIPKTGDGGAGFFQIVFFETVTAGQYIELMWLPESTTVSLAYTAAGAIAPAIPSAIVCADRIA